MIKRYFLHFSKRDKAYIYTINIHTLSSGQETLAPPSIV